MIQAFVLLKSHHPQRTESEIGSFLEAVCGATFGAPTLFRTNADAVSKPWDVTAAAAAAAKPGCKFIAIRLEGEKFWQCTFLLPDENGDGALFFDLQRHEGGRRVSADVLIEMFRRLNSAISPRLIRVGDSEAREALKSRHGLNHIPAIGQVEWLHLVAKDVYAGIYNSSDLAMAPGYASEIMDDGTLFLRVYDDPNDWDTEDSKSQSNFVPGFLAGSAKISDADRERENVQLIDRMWNRAEKTAGRAYEALDSDVSANPSLAPKKSVPPVGQEGGNKGPGDDEGRGTQTTPALELSEAEVQMRDTVLARVRADFEVEDGGISKAGNEGICTVFRVEPKGKSAFYATYQDLDHKVFLLNDADDLARFLGETGSHVKESDLEGIASKLDKYYRPEYRRIESVEALPAEVRGDRRVSDIGKRIRAASVRDEAGNSVCEFWFFKPATRDIESLKLTQLESWPIHADLKVECTDLEVSAKGAVKPSEEAPRAAADLAEAARDLSSDIDGVINAPVASAGARPRASSECGLAAKNGGGESAPVNKVAVALIIIVVIAVIYWVLSGNNG